ncbi:MAG: hypothetical protein HY721_03365, partial [Planctomycetes bacterium]|nr:hypothetical protein [Planctomycetota bacterium]
MRDRDDDEAAGGSATVSCWFCDHRLTARQVLRDGILRSRAEEAGGPYRILQCPACGRENLCERTRRGMWFSSPSSKVSFLDYLFSQYLAGEGAEAATLLAAMTWYRENEERRRYFFERDGDRRYSGRSFLSWLWPAPPGPAGRAGAGRPG